MTLMKLRLEFLLTDLSRHFGVYLVVFALEFFIRLHDGVGSDLKLFVLKNQKPYNHNPEIFKI